MPHPTARHVGTVRSEWDGVSKVSNLYEEADGTLFVVFEDGQMFELPKTDTYREQLRSRLALQGIAL